MALTRAELIAAGVEIPGSFSAESFIPTSSTVPTNGLYLADTNKVAIATNSGGRLFIDASGDANRIAVVSSDTGTSTIGLGDETYNFAGSIAYDNDTNTFTFTRAGTTSYTSQNDHVFYTGGTAKLSIDSSGRLLVGTPNALATVGGSGASTAVTPAVQFAVSGGNSGLLINRPEAFAANIYLASGSDSNAPAEDGILGILHFQGWSSAASAYRTAAWIKAEVDGEPSTSGDTTDMPGRLVFSTTADSVSNPTTRMTIDSSGNVGIGTASPGSYNGDGNDLVIAGSGNKGITISSTSGGTSRIYFADGTTGTEPVIGSIRYQHSNNSLNFSTNAIDRLTIDSSGRLLVGISSSTIPSRLVVKGNTSADFGAGNIALVRGEDAADMADNDGVGTIRFSDQGNIRSAEIASRVDGTPSASVLPGDLVFSTANSAGTLTQRMLIDSSGNVGIGTTSPAAPLVLYNTNASMRFQNSNTGTTATDGLFVGLGNSSSTAAYVYNYEDNHLVFGTNATERVRIDNSGRVGIGASSPGQALHVIGKGRFQEAASSGAIAYIGGDGTAAYIDTGTYSTVSPLAFRLNGTEKARIDSSGRLLVGTSSTSTTTNAIFHGSAGADQGIIYLARSSDPGTTSQIGAITFSGSDHYGVAQISCNRDAGTWTATTSLPSRLSFLTTANGTATPTERMRIASDGNVSIGTTADNFRLWAVGGIDTNIIFRVDGEDTTSEYFSVGIDNNSAIISAGAAGSQSTDLVFRTASAGTEAERMSITSEGFICADSTTRSNKADATSSTGGFKFQASSGSNTVRCEGFTSNTLERFHISFTNGNGVVGSISTNGSATAFNTSSDYRLKENVTAVTDGITRLQQLKPSRFNFIADPDKTVDGFLAHEAAAVVPEAVTGEKDAVDENGNPEYQGIDQSKLVPLLTAALQEAVAKIEVLEAKVAALESA